MPSQDKPIPGSERVQSHRMRESLNGLKRVEVKVAEKDEWIIRSMAEVLKSSEDQATTIRNEISELLPPRREQNLVDFFRHSPLAEASELLEIERSKDTGTPISF